jgi:hypothetical protein
VKIVTASDCPKPITRLIVAELIPIPIGQAL